MTIEELEEKVRVLEEVQKIIFAALMRTSSEYELIKETLQLMTAPDETILSEPAKKQILALVKYLEIMEGTSSSKPPA